MPTLPQSAGPGGTAAAATSVQLVLPRSLLDAQLRHASPKQPGAPTAGTLAHGPLTLQALATQVQALVASLQSGPPQRLAVTHRSAPAPQRPLPSSLALLYIAPPGEAPPPEPAQWENWLTTRAPEFRLACTALVPDVALLWLRRDGLATAWLRTGDAWAALQDGCSPGSAANARHTWLRIHRIALPGAQMLSWASAGHATPQHAPFTLMPGKSANAPAPLQPPGHAIEPPADEDFDTDTPTIRHSRQAAALGPRVLARIQRSRFVLVGSSSTGSMLGHSLARMGASLLVLDPARMAPHNLDGDLPPLHEGQPRPVALQHLLRGLLRPGARSDARALPISSPAAASLLAEADFVLCCTANPAARLWTNAWALALLKPLLAVRTAAGRIGGDGHESLQAELHLLPPATGCLQCAGSPSPAGAPAWTEHSATPRSWHGVAAHAALRLLEHLYDGRMPGPLVRHLAETEDGGLQVQDSSASPSARLHCPLCQRLQGAGLSAVQPAMLSLQAQPAI